MFAFACCIEATKRVKRREKGMDLQKIIDDIRSDRIKDIIVDCDMGADGDDQFACGYALASEDKVRVLAVTCAPYNENSDETVEWGKKESEEIIAASGKKVKYGALAGCPDYITKRGGPVPCSAVDTIARIVREADGPVYSVSTGCITNIASALSLYPDIREKLVTIWLGLDGLDSDSNTGEYNYHNDIEGGKMFFELSENILLVEAGRTVGPFARTDEQIEEQYGESVLARFLAKRFKEISWAQGLWDLCAESVLIIPDACEFRICNVPVFDEKGEICGFNENKQMIAFNKNDHERIALDAQNRINSNN